MTNWKDFFDCIYLINLEKRVDRLFNAVEELEKFDIPYKRICAVEKENGAEGLRDTMLIIFREAEEQGYQNILVFEDDILFLDEDVNLEMNKVVEQLPKDYRLLFLGAQYSNGFTHFHSPNLLPVTKAFATHATCYSALAIKEILAFGMQFPIDNWMVTDVQTRGGCYGTYPLLATQREGYSDIAKNTLSWRPFIDGRYAQKIAELKSRL